MPQAALDQLETEARREMALLNWPARAWTVQRRVDEAIVHDTVVVGGGQNGVAIAFGLAREGVRDVVVQERAAPGAEGPWRTYARMRSLRTPKHLTGPDLGIPSLTPRAWYEARYGTEAWAALGKISRHDWADYLAFVARVTGVRVAHGVDIVDLEPVGRDLVRVHRRRADTGAPLDPLLARTVVLATGIEGAGRWVTPRVLREGIAPDRRAHTADRIDFAALAGRRVLVVGGGASAFDNAAEALEHGAARATVLVRRAALPLANPNRWMEFSGFLRHFADLDDAARWRFMRRIVEMSQPPPQETWNRCAALPGFSVVTGAGVEAARDEDGEIVLETPAGAFRGDFVIAGTGFVSDPRTRPELARLAPHVALWRDRYAPPPGEDCAALAECPYLAPDFSLVRRDADAPEALERIRLYTFAAMPSLGSSAGISVLKFGVERVVRGITRTLFLEEAGAHYGSLVAYDEPELDMGTPVAEPAPPASPPLASRNTVSRP